MKKMITRALALVLVASLTACGQSPDTAAPKAGGSSSEAPSQSAGSEASSQETESVSIFGKITGIVGNEIEFAVAKLPDTEPPAPPNSSDGSKPSEIPAATMTPATDAIEADEAAGELMELTGETYSLTIPSGLKIISMGQEVNLTSLKKGNIVTIRLDNLTDKNVLSLDVLQ